MPSTSDPIVIVAARRTPIANFQGDFKDLTAPELGAAAIQAVQKDAVVNVADIDEVLMGCVLSAGLGQAPARQAALKAGLSSATGCTTINKVCGSAMKAVMLAHDLLAAGSARIIIAGGMESMTNAPYLLRARAGCRLGHQPLIDHMLYDGLENADQPRDLMGVFGEQCAKTLHFSREAQDAFALDSLLRAKNATEQGLFATEIVPVYTQTREGERLITQDQGPLVARPEKIPHLKPAFQENGTITAANSASISDGAAALMLMRRSEAHARQLTPLATISGFASHAQAPALFPTAPITAIQKLIASSGITCEEIDLFEINEAFAVVPMAAMQALDLPHEKVNVRGGACVLGHPIGASGARIMVTLIHALRERGLKRGVAALCIGGGEATAILLEVS
jgi:acetyl-CoA C-acetyltransferase